jgi:segregation and condensation protein B
VIAGGPADRLRLLEAILFAAPEPLGADELRVRTGADDVGRLLVELRENYAGRGVELVETGGKWRFRTAPDLAEAIARPIDVARKLSRAALETLAIIAYHQPVTRPEIEGIRGVATSRGTLDQLMEIGWVRTGKRREVPGRPLTWVTTEAFLHHFGLPDLRDLPGLEDLRAIGMLDARPVLAAIPGAGGEGESGDDAP